MHYLAGFAAFFLFAISLSVPQTDRESDGRLNNEFDLSSMTFSVDYQRSMQKSQRGRRLHSRHRHLPKSRVFQETLPTLIAIKIKKFIKSMKCSRAQNLSMTTSMCKKIRAIQFNETRLYMTPWPTEANYSVVIPRGRLTSNSSHDVVAVLDPFPRAGFGHLIMIFYIDRKTEATCKRKSIIRNRGRCLVLARKICANTSICEVDFIPLVYDSSTPNDQKRIQALECLPYIKGFDRCPKTVVDSFLPDCEHAQNPQRCNAKRALKKKVPKHWKFNQFYKTCDYALMLFGGWNDVTKQLWNEDNIQTFHSMLQRNGFQKDYIKIFYGGENHEKYMRDIYGETLCSSDKSVLRNHITTLCQNPFCDSFVIYMNGPTVSDGSILLWDKNENGKAEPAEIYNVEEFLDDIFDCSANHVFVFADQSYSGIFTSSLSRRSSASTSTKGPGGRNPWKNVILFTSGNSTDYSWHRDATAQWSTLNPNETVSAAYKNKQSLHSKPTYFNLQRSQDLTIYGAPFEEELDRNADDFKGCQDLPKAQWTLNFDA